MTDSRSWHQAAKRLRCLVPEHRPRWTPKSGHLIGNAHTRNAGSVSGANHPAALSHPTFQPCYWTRSGGVHALDGAVSTRGNVASILDSARELGIRDAQGLGLGQSGYADWSHLSKRNSPQELSRKVPANDERRHAGTGTPGRSLAGSPTRFSPDRSKCIRYFQHQYADAN